MKAKEVDQIVCHGDCAVLGPDPHGALTMIREHAAMTVLGNVDGWIRDVQPNHHPQSSTCSLFNDITAWSRAQLSHQDRDWIGGLPTKATVNLGEGRTLVAFHGSPQSFDVVIDATACAVEIADMFTGFTADLFAGGHTHVPLMRYLSNGLLVNPGSVGLPRTGPGTPGLHSNVNVTWADYAIVATSSLGAIAVEFRRLPLPITEMVAEAGESGMPGFAWWRDCWAKPLT